MSVKVGVARPAMEEMDVRKLYMQIFLGEVEVVRSLFTTWTAEARSFTSRQEYGYT